MTGDQTQQEKARSTDRIPAEPAFPIAELGQYVGLSKRELFAAMAIQGICANPKIFLDLSTESLAKEGLLIADTLLKELSK